MHSVKNIHPSQAAKVFGCPSAQVASDEYFIPETTIVQVRTPVVYTRYMQQNKLKRVSMPRQFKQVSMKPQHQKAACPSAPAMAAPVMAAGRPFGQAGGDGGCCNKGPYLSRQGPMAPVIGASARQAMGGCPQGAVARGMMIQGYQGAVPGFSGQAAYAPIPIPNSHLYGTVPQASLAAASF